MDAQFSRWPPAAPDGSHIIISSRIGFLKPLLTSAKGGHEKRKRSQYQWLWAKEACSLYYMVNKATEEVKPLHLPTSRAERQSARAAECSLRAEPQTPPVKGKRERGGEWISSVLILPFVKQHVENDLHCELFAELDSVLFHSRAET